MSTMKLAIRVAPALALLLAAAAVAAPPAEHESPFDTERGI